MSLESCLFTQVLLLSCQFSNTSYTFKRIPTLVLSSALNFSGYANKLLLSVGSGTCCKKWKLLNQIVGFYSATTSGEHESVISHIYLPSANFISINMYLTRQVDDDMLWNVAANDAGVEYDPLTLLRSRTSFGRPDWMSIYGRISQAIQTGQYIPGIDPRRKTRVGVSAFSFQCNAIHESIFFCVKDVLLWPRRPCQSYQKGNSAPHNFVYRVHLFQGP
jgi:hypothetical protein